MTELAPVLAGLAIFLLATAILHTLWEPTIAIVRKYFEVSTFLDPLQALVVACGHNRFGRVIEEESWRTGLTNQPHDQLNLTVRQYERGLWLSAVVISLGLTVVMAIALRSWAALVLGIISAVSLRFLIELSIRDTIRTNHLEQLRQFPFFLDIFQLTVQSGGDLGDAINAYRTIYKTDAIGRELAILQQSAPAFDDAESLSRLRNRVGNVELKNVIGELAQKIRTGIDLETTLAQQSEDMRDLREELAAKRAEELRANYNWPVVITTIATFLIFLSAPIAIIVDSGFF